MALLEATRGAWASWWVRIPVSALAFYMAYTGATGRQLLWKTAPSVFGDLSETGQWLLLVAGIGIVALAWGPLAYANFRTYLAARGGDMNALIRREAKRVVKQRRKRPDRLAPEDNLEALRELYRQGEALRVQWCITRTIADGVHHSMAFASHGADPIFEWTRSIRRYVRAELPEHQDELGVSSLGDPPYAMHGPPSPDRERMCEQLEKDLVRLAAIIKSVRGPKPG